MNAMQALNRARVAWERTSPQLVIDGWLDMLDELDEAHSSAVRLVEPARTHAPLTAHSPAGGLNPGAEPCRGRAQLTAGGQRATVGTASLVSSAPHQHDGGCRISPEESRGSRQEGA